MDKVTYGTKGSDLLFHRTPLYAQLNDVFLGKEMEVWRADCGNEGWWVWGGGGSDGEGWATVKVEGVGGGASVVGVPLARLMDKTRGGTFDLAGTSLTQQVEATQGIAGEVLTLHIVADALSKAPMFDL